MEKAERIREGQQYSRVFEDEDAVVKWLTGVIRQILLGNEADISESDRSILTQVIRRGTLRNLRLRRARPSNKLLNAYVYHILWRVVLDDHKSQDDEAISFDDEQNISFDELVRMLRPAPDEGDEGGLTFQNPHQRLTVKGNFELTPRFLSTVLAPYLEAVAAVQQVSDAVMRWPPRGVLVKSISHQSPIDVSLSGAADAITALKEDIIPWRKKHAKELAELRATHVRAEIRKKEAEALEIEARSEKETAESEKIRAEAAKVREEARQLQLENETREIELQRAKINLALELVSKMRPDLPPSDKYVYAMRMLPAINTLATSEIEPDQLIP